jgi:preprotein translocase subunit SecD
MSKTYEPFADRGDAYPLAARSLGRQEKIDRLEYRLKSTSQERRAEIRQQWDLPNEPIRLAEERLRAVQAALEDEEDEAVRKKLEDRMKGLQQRVESAADLEPISYPEWVRQTALTLFADLASVEDKELDVEVIRRAHEDFTLRANGTSREEVDAQLNALTQSVGSIPQATGTTNGQPTTGASPR